MLKQLRAQEVDYDADYRQAEAAILKTVLELGMAARTDCHLDEMTEREEADRRNSSYGRWLMTKLGEIVRADSEHWEWYISMPSNRPIPTR